MGYCIFLKKEKVSWSNFTVWYLRSGKPQVISQIALESVHNRQEEIIVTLMKQSPRHVFVVGM